MCAGQELSKHEDVQEDWKCRQTQGFKYTGWKGVSCGTQLEYIEHDISHPSEADALNKLTEKPSYPPSPLPGTFYMALRQAAKKLKTCYSATNHEVSDAL
jgi:hypothetical protein